MLCRNALKLLNAKNAENAKVAKVLLRFFLGALGVLGELGALKKTFQSRATGDGTSLTPRFFTYCPAVLGALASWRLNLDIS